MLRASYVLFLPAMLGLAQEAIHYASLSGRVKDPSGAVVEGALVTARHLDTNLPASLNTDSEGRFRFSYLKLGLYEIKVEQKGFAVAGRSFTLNAGAAYDLTFNLEVGKSDSSVEVRGESAVLEASRSQIAGTVAQAETAATPINGRNFLDLALLIPGVSPTNTGSNQLFAETSAVPGQGISIGSQRNFSNSFVVDGLSANDDAAGLSGAFLGLDTVLEFQVVTSGGQAEFGRALGGFVSVVSKSGANTRHGDLYGYFRNQRWNAANPLSNTTLPVTQAQYGLSLGGPVTRDRTFYFGNFEQRQLNQSGLATITPANASAIDARLAAIGYQGLGVVTGIYPNPVHMTTLFGKLDHQFTSHDQFSARYSLYEVSSQNSRGAGGLSAPSASAGLDNTDQTIAVSNIWAIGSRTVNETRGQFTHSDLTALPTDLNGAAVSISGVASFGRLSGSPAGRLNKLFEFTDNFSHQQGAHALRAGLNLLYNDATITFPRSIRGSYSFASLANFLSATYNSPGFTQTFGNGVIGQTNPNFGMYVQDEWKLNSSFTVNLGVRYDLQGLQTIATDTNNVSPRAGFAWTPFAARNTVIRGGFGLFYDRVPLRALANALLSSNNTTALTGTSQVSISLSPTQAGAPVFPNIITTLPASVLVNFTTMDPHIQNAYSDQGSIEIEHKLTNSSTLSVGYQHVRGLHLIISINQNVPSCVAAGTNNGCRPNPAYANNSQYKSQADSKYDGLHISFVQRPVRWGSYRVSYAHSKALDNVGEFFFSGPIDPFNIWRDRARSDDDQRHRFVFNGVAHVPFGVELSAMLQYYSTLPLNITTGSNTIQGTAARPTVNGGFIDRNAGTGADFLNLNVRLSRTFRFAERLRVEALAEGFNSLNHRNNLTYNGVFGSGAYPISPSATFGQVTAVNDPRVMQVALRLKF